MLIDKDNKCQPLYFALYKAKQVAISVLGSEIMTFTHAFEMA